MTNKKLSIKNHALTFETYRSKVSIFVWKIAGFICVGLAVVGAVLPVMPTTIFLIMATTCFAKSSPKLQRKLLNNKIFGPMIIDWQQNRTIPRKAKKIALFTIILSVLWSAYLLQNLILVTAVILLVAGPFIYLWRLPVSEEHSKFKV